MGGPIMARNDRAKCPVRKGSHGRAQSGLAQARGRSETAQKSEIGRTLLAAGVAHVLGAPGRTRAAHIVQFRPVGVERLGKEGAPEGEEFRERLFRRGLAGGGGGAGGRNEDGHDAGAVVFTAALAALGAIRRAESELSPDSLKTGFNFRDRLPVWCRTRNHPW